MGKHGAPAAAQAAGGTRVVRGAGVAQASHYLFGKSLPDAMLARLAGAPAGALVHVKDVIHAKMLDITVMDPKAPAGAPGYEAAYTVWKDTQDNTLNIHTGYVHLHGETNQGLGT